MAEPQGCLSPLFLCLIQIRSRRCWLRMTLASCGSALVNVHALAAGERVMSIVRCISFPNLSSIMDLQTLQIRQHVPCCATHGRASLPVQRQRGNHSRPQGLPSPGLGQLAASTVSRHRRRQRSPNCMCQAASSKQTVAITGATDPAAQAWPGSARAAQSVSLADVSG